MYHVKIWAPCVKICWVFLIIIHEFCWDCINFSFSWFFKVRKYILVYLYVDFYFYVLGFTILFINLIYSVYISNNMTTIRMDDYAKKNSIFKYINMLYNVCLEILLYIIVFFINLPRLRVVECWRKTKKKKTLFLRAEWDAQKLKLVRNPTFSCLKIFTCKKDVL